MDEKQQLILDIQNLLNTYGENSTQINPALLEYMNAEELKAIIDNLLSQKETIIEENLQWLEQFKKEN